MGETVGNFSSPEAYIAPSGTTVGWAASRSFLISTNLIFPHPMIKVYGASVIGL